MIGRTPPRDTLVKLDFSSSNLHGLTELDMLTWPSFHNGVAAGLRLVAGSYGEWQVTQNWIMFNRPTKTPLAPEEVRSPASILEFELDLVAHGGLLLGLGIHKHLGSLSKPNWFSYLKQGNEALSVGFLLGLGCQYRGTSNKDFAVIVTMHIPHLYVVRLGDQISSEVSSAIQVSIH